MCTQSNMWPTELVELDSCRRGLSEADNKTDKFCYYPRKSGSKLWFDHRNMQNVKETLPGMCGCLDKFLTKCDNNENSSECMGKSVLECPTLCDKFKELVQTNETNRAIDQANLDQRNILDRSKETARVMDGHSLDSSMQGKCG